MQTIIAVDPGNEISGLIIIDGDQVVVAENIINAFLFDRISAYHSKLLDGGRTRPAVVIEDMAPYFSRLKPEVIGACKFIGELAYRLKEAAIRFEYLYRTQVKKFAFDAFPEVAIPRIEAKIKARKKLTKAGEPFKPSFVWVDDRIVIACMKEYWQIETPKPGHSNRLGVSKHAWQALALATLYIERLQRLG
jgi:hypothetical protein